jgi:hypothetical protein
MYNSVFFKTDLSRDGSSDGPVFSDAPNMIENEKLKIWLLPVGKILHVKYLAE